MYENRIAHLKEAHRFIDQQVTEMERSGNFKDTDLNDLKKKRLFLKDEIAILERKQYEYDNDTLEHWDDEER
jgi:hypothetical protein